MPHSPKEEMKVEKKPKKSGETGLEDSLTALNFEDEGSDADSEDNVTSGKVYKKLPHKYLFLGEGDFSFARSFVKKHPKRANKITATEYQAEENLPKFYPKTFKPYQEYLTKKGVKVAYGVDATKLDESKELKSERYPRIHFNFPHDKSNYQQQTLPKLLDKFFANASKKQEFGDRVYMALPKPKAKNGDYNEFYKGYVYNIYQASSKHGYRLIKKREFGSERYKKYNHVMTAGGGSAAVADDPKEYIFVKTNLTQDEILKLDKKEKRPPKLRSFYSEDRYCIPEISTESDSSSSDADEAKYHSPRAKC